MYPELLHFAHLTIYSYAFLIGMGILIAGIFTKKQIEKYWNGEELSYAFFYGIFIMGFVGGKLFFFLERPGYYLSQPELILQDFSGGYVFYGSFLLIIPYIIWYLHKNNKRIWPVLDILAITTTIVHAIGRLGCFFGGCCYGKPTGFVTGVEFPATHGVHVHPTQLYESFGIFLIMFFLFKLRKRKKFDGQIFLTYVFLYAFLRIIIENYRGDQRGYLIEGILSHSQFIALVIMSFSIYLLNKLKSKNYTYETVP